MRNGCDIARARRLLHRLSAVLVDSREFLERALLRNMLAPDEQEIRRIPTQMFLVAPPEKGRARPLTSGEPAENILKSFRHLLWAIEEYDLDVKDVQRLPCLSREDELLC